MHLRLALAQTALVLLLAGCASHPVKRLPPVHNIPAEVAADFRQAVAAWNAGDLNGFVAIYADHATLAMEDSFLQGRPAIREYYAPVFEPGAERPTLTFDQFDVEVLSPTVALVRAVFRNTEAGQVVRRGTTTLILRRELDHWRVIHDHTC
jgi:uncharacterized protein (TIGR02246 family)